MKIAFVVDARLVVITSIAGVLGVFALHAAYPGLFVFWPTKSDELAAWVQVVGSIGAIAGAIWIADRQSREKQENDLLRAQLAAAGISVRLSRFSYELQRFSRITGFSEVHSENPEMDEFKSIQEWLSKPVYRPEPSEFIDIIALPNNAAHRLARGYEMLQLLRERLKPGGEVETVFVTAAPTFQREMLSQLMNHIATASDMVAVASKECEKATHAGAPYPSTKELWGP